MTESENRVLRRTYVPERYEIIGSWRQLHNEELHYLCFSTNLRLSNKEDEMDRVYSTNRTEVYSEFRLGKLKKGDS
jgi:hypothetical protein